MRRGVRLAGAAIAAVLAATACNKGSEPSSDAGGRAPPGASTPVAVPPPPASASASAPAAAGEATPAPTMPLAAPSSGAGEAAALAPTPAPGAPAPSSAAEVLGDAAPRGGAAPAEKAPRLEPPTSVVATAASETEVDVRWEARPGSTDVASFEVLRDGVVVATTEAASARVGGLAPTQRACYAVRGVDRAGRRSRPSASACAVTPDLTPPEAPAELAAEAVSDREVALRWAAARDRVGVVGYEVLDGGTAVAITAATTAHVAGRSPWREYCFTVVAYDAAGNRSAPSTRACARTLDVTPPTPPATPAAVATAETRIELDWGESSDDAGVKEYRVLRGDAVVAKTDGRTARDTGLRAGTEYCYRILAVDAAGNVSAPAGPVCARTPDRTPPTQPGAVTVKPLGEDRLEVRWTEATDNVGVAGYEVRRTGEVRARETSLVVVEAGLRPFTEYCYTVVAFDAAGNRSAPTVSQCARTLDVTAPTTPRGVVVRPPAHQRLEARWGVSSDNDKVARYELLRDGQVVATSTGPAAEVWALADATQYCFTVRAQDPAGNRSPESAPTCAKTLAPDQPVPPRNVDIVVRPGVAQIRWEAAGRPDVIYRVYEDRRPVGSTRFFTYAVRRSDGKRHCYGVEAVDEAGRASPRTEDTCATFLGDASSAR
jgi:chitodextrinase